MGKFFDWRYCPVCGEEEPDLSQILLWVEEYRLCFECREPFPTDALEIPPPPELTLPNGYKGGWVPGFEEDHSEDDYDYSEESMP
jgi:hypothetical protein